LLAFNVADFFNFANLPSPARGPRETFSLAAAGALVLGAIATVVGGCGWNTERKKKSDPDPTWMRKKWVCALEVSVL
jgi:hypothetical protein